MLLMDVIGEEEIAVDVGRGREQMGCERSGGVQREKGGVWKLPRFRGDNLYFRSDAPIGRAVESSYYLK